MENIVKYLFTLGCLLTAVPIVQGQSLQFNDREIHIGPIDDWSQDAAIFVFRNMADKKLAILRAESPEDVKVSYPRRFIQPGESDTIIAWYMPREPGPFNTSFSLLNSLDNEWLKLEFSGDVLSYDACPDPLLAPGESGPGREIIVLDSTTLMPVRNALIEMVHNDNKLMKGRTDRKGQLEKDLEPGLYGFRISAEGYDDLNTGFYLNFSRRKLTFYLAPVMVQEQQEMAGIIEGEGQSGGTAEQTEERQQDVRNEASADGQTRDPEPGEAAKEEEQLAEDDFVIRWPSGGEEPQNKAETLNEYDEEGRLSREVFAENNIVFLIDVSSSMRTRSKMDRLQAAVGDLITRLRDIDRISVITYSRRSEVLAEGVAGNAKDSLNGLIRSLEGRGSTYGIVGLNDAYRLAGEHFIPGGNNQLIIATDGEFNSPGYSDRKLERMMKDWKDSGIILSVIGFGQNEKAVERMSMMARLGGGRYLDFRPGIRVEEVLLREIKMNSRKD